MSEHTKGKWKVLDGAIISDHLNEYGNFHIVDLPERPEGCENDEDKANANLIAAAPELLEACKWFVGALETGLLVRDITKDGQPDWSIKMLSFVKELQNAQTAIAKAETI